MPISRRECPASRRPFRFLGREVGAPHVEFGGAAPRPAGRSRFPILSCVTLWNTVYSNAALERPRSEGSRSATPTSFTCRAYQRAHINVTGHYWLVVPARRGLRMQRDPDAAEELTAVDTHSPADAGLSDGGSSAGQCPVGGFLNRRSVRGRPAGVDCRGTGERRLGHEFHPPPAVEQHAQRRGDTAAPARFVRWCG